MDKNKILAIAIKIMGLFFLAHAFRYLIRLIITFIRMQSENSFDNSRIDDLTELSAGLLLFGIAGAVLFLYKHRSKEVASHQIDDDPTMEENLVLSFDTAKFLLRLFGLYMISTEGASLLTNLLWQIRYRFFMPEFYPDLNYADILFEIAYPLTLVVFGIIIFRAPNWLLNKLR